MCSVVASELLHEIIQQFFLIRTGSRSTFLSVSSEVRSLGEGARRELSGASQIRNKRLATSASPRIDVSFLADS